MTRYIKTLVVAASLFFSSSEEPTPKDPTSQYDR